MVQAVSPTQHIQSVTYDAIKHTPVSCDPFKDDRFPHTCPRCKGPAYIGAFDVDCKNRCK